MGTKEVVEEDIKPSGPKIFGRDISQIPCFRDSYLYGLTTGIGAGLATFLATSQPRKSSHTGFTLFCITTLGYWFYCRHYWETQKQEALALNYLMRELVQSEGTQRDPRPDVTPPEIVTVSSSGN